ncbi:hypothetical protein Syun_011979 [Stephania yunnanensis]|uniref:Uncharacterized protein n=1 Tax=Stephania yunnanensis TaxID=152371 RepID=A0AAP0JZC2_9MAGN
MRVSRFSDDDFGRTFCDSEFVYEDIAVNFGYGGRFVKFESCVVLDWQNSDLLGRDLMDEISGRWNGVRSAARIAFTIIVASAMVSAERGLRREAAKHREAYGEEMNYVLDLFGFPWKSDESGYQHVWPEMKFGWKIVLGTIIGFLGAAFGSVGGVGGGEIFVPMLTLIIGFDLKSSTAISKLLIQPMLMLGISIGVAFNVIFADWMVTVLLIFLFIGTSTKAFFKGVETWKTETILKREATMQLESNGSGQIEYKPLPSEPSNGNEKEKNKSKERKVSVVENVYWKEFGLLVFVWAAFLALQIAKNTASNCSAAYWILNLLQIPVAVGVTAYEAVSLYKGKRMISSKGEAGTNFTVLQLIAYSSCGVLAGIVGGLLGLGGGFIMGPLFSELGVPPQVSCATATFAMTFSSSMSVVEYYLLKRFPVPYALYFLAIATVAAFIGQHVVVLVYWRQFTRFSTMITWDLRISANMVLFDIRSSANDCLTEV